MKQAYLREMYKKTSKSVCTPAVVISPDPLLLPHQLLQLYRLQKNTEETMITPNQQMETYKCNTSLISFAAQLY